MKKFFEMVFLYFMSLYGSWFPQDIVIVQKPIAFEQKRIELTQKFRKEHYNIDSKSIVIKPVMIVVHWTASPSFNGTFNYFYSPELRAKKSYLNKSSHFLIDKDGTIYQLMPSNWMAKHITALSNVSIGIENVGGERNKQNLTAAQLNSNVKLIRHLKKQYPAIKYLIGHYEYTQFKNTPLWQEKKYNHFPKKSDPGPIFMQNLRSQLKDLNLSGTYTQ